MPDTRPRLMPQPLDAARSAFPANVRDLLPKWEDIPDEFKSFSGKWQDVVTAWFFSGVQNCQWKPREGVDTQAALLHVGACMGSFEPKHEHKEAGCAYLLSEFFEDVTYEKCVRPAPDGGPRA